MARKCALVGIVEIVCVQSFLGYIVYYSLDAPSSFKTEYTQTGEKLETIHNKTKDSLLSLLDYGQKPTQKKQTAPSQLAVSFNLFIHNAQVNLPASSETEIRTNNSYHYTAYYTQAYFEIIPHPPQFG